MKKMIIACAACALFAGCDYTVPLVKSPETPIDPAVVGVWQRTVAEGKKESLVILPMGEREYLVVFPSGSDDAMFARACLWRNAGVTLVQLDWVGTMQGKRPDDNRTFQFASYSVDSKQLTLRMLNTGVVAKDVASSEALAKAIADNKKTPGLFREEMVFQKDEE